MNCNTCFFDTSDCDDEPVFLASVELLHDSSQTQYSACIDCRNEIQSAQADPGFCTQMDEATAAMTSLKIKGIDIHDGKGSGKVCLNLSYVCVGG